MNEMSETGFSLFLDFQLPLSASYHLKLHIVHQGKAFAMDVQAQSVYAILVRFDGFRHGFQFAALDAAAEDVIRTVLA